MDQSTLLTSIFACLLIVFNAWQNEFRPLLCFLCMRVEGMQTPHLTGAYSGQQTYTGANACRPQVLQLQHLLLITLWSHRLQRLLLGTHLKPLAVTPASEDAFEAINCNACFWGHFWSHRLERLLLMTLLQPSTLSPASGDTFEAINCNACFWGHFWSH